MLSLAFILAFIGSAVALLIGIIIFSEVTEAMALTLPEILVTIPTTPEVEGLWFGREHCPVTSCEPTTFENRMGILAQNTNPVQPSVTLNGQQTDATRTDGYVGRVFDKSELDGKLVTLEYQD